MKQIFASIKLYLSYYLAVATILGVVWGVYAAYDNWRDENKILQENVNTIIKTQSQQARADSILLEQQSKMNEQLNEVYKTTQSLQSSYVRYISRDKTLTKQDFLEYMEGLSFDVKKNSSSTLTKPPLLNPQTPPQEEMAERW